MLQLGLLIVGMFVLQAVLSVLQMRHFSREFMKLRRRGKVACGRQAGGFHAGAIVMFLIDGDGMIQEGKKLFGVTCFARVTELPGFEGKYVGGLTEEEARLAEAKGAALVTLGRRILRTETAAIAAMSILMYVWGDLSGEVDELDE